MSGAIAIFAKTPGLSPIKTRLSADIGRDRADELYLAMLDAVETSVRKFLKPHKDWIARWAVAEAAGVADDRWRKLGARPTGSGKLGERMWRVYEAFRRVHGRVLLIGADAPQITAAHLKRAAAALAEQDFVLGPAEDGGFWLFGGRRVVPKAAWASVRWSSEHASSDFLAAMKATGLSEPVQLEFLTDADEKEDLKSVARQMPDSPTAPQRRVIELLEAAR